MGPRNFNSHRCTLIFMSCWMTIFSVSGNWTEWSEWAPCSVSCGEGIHKRFRVCDRIPVENGGELCEPDPDGALQIEVCKDIKPCAVHGGWSDWSDWGPCEKQDCLQKTLPSLTFRHRTCTNPLPRHEGAMCQGPFMDANICVEETNCQVDGGWGEWSEWICLEAMAKRTRSCDSPAPRNNGKPCPVIDAMEFYTLKDDPETYKNICRLEEEEKEEEYEDDIDNAIDDGREAGGVEDYNYENYD